MKRAMPSQPTDTSQAIGVAKSLNSTPVHDLHQPYTGDQLNTRFKLRRCEGALSVVKKDEGQLDLSPENQGLSLGATRPPIQEVVELIRQLIKTKPMFLDSVERGILDKRDRNSKVSHCHLEINPPPQQLGCRCS